MPVSSQASGFELPSPGLELDSPGLLLIDLQYGDADPQSAYVQRRRARDGEDAYRYYTRRLAECVIPNAARLQARFRDSAREVLFVRIESRTRDGRDRGADHVARGIHFPPGAKEGLILDEIAPLDDEIVLSKTSDSAFVGTGLADLLANLGVHDLVVAGVVTGSCVRATALDALSLARAGARAATRTVVVADATATWSAALQRATEDELRDAGAAIETTERVLSAVRTPEMASQRSARTTGRPP